MCLVDLWRLLSSASIIELLQFRNLTANLSIRPLEKLRLKGNLASTVKKLIYAIVWQESRIKIPFVFDPTANLLGALSLPVVNGIANAFNDFTYFEKSFQVSVGEHQTSHDSNLTHFIEWRQSLPWR